MTKSMAQDVPWLKTPLSPSCPMAQDAPLSVVWLKVSHGSRCPLVFPSFPPLFSEVSGGRLPFYLREASLYRGRPPSPGEGGLPRFIRGLMRKMCRACVCCVTARCGKMHRARVCCVTEHCGKIVHVSFFHMENRASRIFPLRHFSTMLSHAAKHHDHEYITYICVTMDACLLLLGVVICMLCVHWLAGGYLHIMPTMYENTHIPSFSLHIYVYVYYTYIMYMHAVSKHVLRAGFFHQGIPSLGH